MSKPDQFKGAPKSDGSKIWPSNITWGQGAMISRELDLKKKVVLHATNMMIDPTMTGIYIHTKS